LIFGLIADLFSDTNNKSSVAWGSGTMEGKKKRGRPATGRGAQVQVRLQPILLQQIDLWRGNRSDAPGRPEAVRRLIQLGLAAHPARRATMVIHSPDDPD